MRFLRSAAVLPPEMWKYSITSTDVVCMNVYMFTEHNVERVDKDGKVINSRQKFILSAKHSSFTQHSATAYGTTLN